MHFFPLTFLGNLFFFFFSYLARRWGVKCFTRELTPVIMQWTTHASLEAFQSKDPNVELNVVMHVLWLYNASLIVFNSFCASWKFLVCVCWSNRSCCSSSSFSLMFSFKSNISARGETDTEREREKKKSHCQISMYTRSVVRVWCHVYNMYKHVKICAGRRSKCSLYKYFLLLPYLICCQNGSSVFKFSCKFIISLWSLSIFTVWAALTFFSISNSSTNALTFACKWRKFDDTFSYKHTEQMYAVRMG